MCDGNSIVRAAAAAAVVLAMAAASAQTPSFDAASLRPSAQRAPGADWVLRPGGQFIASNITVAELIGVAYSVEPFRIRGNPEWTREAQYDVQARAGTDVTPDQTRLMLRSLLQDRFRLRARLERAEVPIHAMVLSRGDGGAGPRLQPAAECAAPTCGRILSNPGRMTGRRVALDLLATRLSPLVNRVVVNRTGLTGSFDLDLDWTPDSGPSFGNRDAPSLFTALEEQLGLKLESSRGPADVVSIETVERPAEN